MGGRRSQLLVSAGLPTREPRPRPVRTAAAACGLALIAIWSVPAAGEGAPGEPVPCASTATSNDGFYDVTVDLDAGAFDKVLDFDRPIRICGALPSGAERIEVQYAVTRRSPAIADASRCVVRQAGGEVVPLLPAPDQAIQALVNAKGGEFFALVPALDPNRFYVFCFAYEQPVGKEEAERFAPAARSVLDAGLAEVKSANINAAQAQQIADRLLDRLLAAAGASRVIEAPPLFLGGAAAATALSEPGAPVAVPSAGGATVDLNTLVVAVLAPQRRRDLIVHGDPLAQTETFASRQLRFNNQLDAIRGDPALGELVAALDAAAATDPNVRGFLSPAFDRALALARLGDEAAGRVALGQASGDASGDSLLTSLDPQVADLAAANYKQTRADLGALRGLLERLLGADPPLPLAASLSEATRAKLAALAAAGGPIETAASAAFTLEGLANRIGTALRDRAGALDRLQEAITLLSLGVKVAAGSSTIAYATLSAVYVSADAGLAYIPEIDEAAKYIGTNIYLRPINKDVPLSQADSFLHRFALTVGLTMDSIADDDAAGNPRTRDDLFGSQSLLLGAGLRFNRVIRFGAGALVFKEQDPNPLRSDLSVTVSPYVTFSFDLNVASAFKGGFGDLFKPGSGG